ncbi:DUF2589 domain-containing protein [Kordia algicida OT-1]|uniref:DUF2589 domain-containing protein n=1 Tax=Kordia algicida OT-1 TaxID=391587 RepID=A9DNM9_9FLAO|nr:DUF2589 domain-containing protein [Kordia algicida]EDP97230.1 hypothetical protein KAOT1_18747 [Kordia algicida OT-1]
MPVSPNEIASINFSAMLGKPLTAVIDAQAAAALSTVDFINEVGLNADGTVKNVSFIYSKLIDGTVTEVTLTTPLLTIVPIPFLRVADTTIDFNAKISSVTEFTSTTSHKLDLSAELSLRWAWGRFKFKGSYSYQKKTSYSDEAKRSYSMNVKIHAVQDEIPAGMSRVLDMLEESISETETTP